MSCVRARKRSSSTHQGNSTNSTISSGGIRLKTFQRTKPTFNEQLLSIQILWYNLWRITGVRYSKRRVDLRPPCTLYLVLDTRALQRRCFVTNVQFSTPTCFDFMISFQSGSYPSTEQLQIYWSRHYKNYSSSPSSHLLRSCSLILSVAHTCISIYITRRSDGHDYSLRSWVVSP